MVIINSKQVLNRIIKEAFLDDPKENIEFPRMILFCDSVENPVYRITIEKIEKDFFIDKSGQKWIKEKK